MEQGGSREYLDVRRVVGYRRLLPGGVLHLARFLGARCAPGVLGIRKFDMRGRFPAQDSRILVREARRSFLSFSPAIHGRVRRRQPNAGSPPMTDAMSNVLRTD